MWGRVIREDELRDPFAVQDLYEIAVEQGFCLEGLDTARINFFALARYAVRQKRIENKVGLFTTSIDRTVKDNFGLKFEQKLSLDDEDWALEAIKRIDQSTIERT